MKPHTEIIQYIFQRELIHYILCTGSILGLYIRCVKCTFSVSILFRRLLLLRNILLFTPLHLRETYHSLIFWIEPRPAPICPILLSWLFSMKLLNRLTEDTEEFILKLHWTNCTPFLYLTTDSLIWSSIQVATHWICLVWLEMSQELGVIWS